MPCRLALVLLVLGLLVACTDGGPRSGGSPEYPWQPITTEQSVLAISGPLDHRHRAHKLGGKYEESAQFTNGVSVFYEFLEGQNYTFSGSGGDLIKGWYNSKTARDAGFVYKSDAAHRTGDTFSLTDSGTSRTCSFYARVFGVTIGGFGEGDQLYLVVGCRPSSPSAAETTEKIVHETALRLRDTPFFSTPLPTLSLTPPTAAAAPTL